MFRAADGSPEGFSLWFRAPGCACMVGDLPAVFGDAPCVQVLSPGITVRGRVRNRDGRPIPGVVLRGTNYPRGPATLTDLEGVFVLGGLDPEEGLQVPAGDHAVVVQRTSRPPTVSESVRWRFRLSEGQVVTKTIRLP